MISKLARYLGNNLLGLLALFVALGGTAYAVNTVRSTDIVDGEVKSVDIGNNEIGSGDVKDNSMNTFDVHSFLGADVVDNTLTGDDINESTLSPRSFQVADSPIQLRPHTSAETFGKFLTANGCHWTNFDTANFGPAIAREDAWGFIHLEGVVKLVGSGCTEASNRGIVQLWEDMRPGYTRVFTTQSNYQLARVDVGPSGIVSIQPPATIANAQQWVSLDGIVIRCGPPGQNGCR